MRLKGSLVIEAAIIFPTIIMAMFALIFFAYYEHDIIVLRSEVKTGLITFVAEKAEDEWKFLEGGKEALFYLTYEDMKSYKSKGSLKAGAKVNFPIFPFVTEYMDKDLTDGSFVEEYKEYLQIL